MSKSKGRGVRSQSSAPAPDHLDRAIARWWKWWAPQASPQERKRMQLELGRLEARKRRRKGEAK